jgi:serine/threonine protein phosphatase PrpC
VLHVFSHSEPGGHAENEDAFEVRCLSGSSGAYLCALADGQGGRAGGVAAARLACRVVLDAAGTLPPARLLLPTTWYAPFAAADRAAADDLTAGFTTLVAFCITDGYICGASNGDSAAILSLPNVSPTILTAAQSKNPPVGSGAAAVMPFGAKLTFPFLMLALSDGVWKYVGWEQVLAIVREQPADKVISSLRDRAATARGGLADDFTIIVCSGDDSGPAAA